MSAITTSSVTRCPSQQESAWGATEARQEKVILEVVRKGIFVVKCWRVCWTHLQIFSVSTVLGEKASDVKQSWEASAKSPDRRPSPRWTGRGPVNEGIMFGKLSAFLFYFIFFFFFFFFRSVHGVCMGLRVRCLGPDLQRHHQAPGVRVSRSQPGQLLKPGRKRLFYRLLGRAFLSWNVGVFLEPIYKYFLSVLF